MQPKKVIVMSIKPEYAKMIYEGKKKWEFRKKAPPVAVPILIYESAPVSKVTGVVIFSLEIRAVPALMWGHIKHPPMGGNRHRDFAGGARGVCRGQAGERA